SPAPPARRPAPKDRPASGRHAGPRPPAARPPSGDRTARAPDPAPARARRESRAPPARSRRPARPAAAPTRWPAPPPAVAAPDRRGGRVPGRHVDVDLAAHQRFLLAEGGDQTLAPALRVRDAPFRQRNGDRL